jgi:hypothetical protein
MISFGGMENRQLKSPTAGMVSTAKIYTRMSTTAVYQADSWLTPPYRLQGLDVLVKLMSAIPVPSTEGKRVRVDYGLQPLCPRTVRGSTAASHLQPCMDRLPGPEGWRWISPGP